MHGVGLVFKLSRGPSLREVQGMQRGAHMSWLQPPLYALFVVLIKPTGNIQLSRAT